VVSGAVGHPAAIDPEWAVPAKALHLLAVSVWLGGLLWILACDRSEPVRFAAEAARVSSLALGAVTVIAASGVVQALLFLPSPADVVRSTYGALVLAKVALFAVLLAFGAYHRYRVLPGVIAAPGGAAPATLRASVTREVVVMYAVTSLSGCLAYVPPPDAPPSPPGISAAAGR